MIRNMNLILKQELFEIEICIVFLLNMVIIKNLQVDSFDDK